VKARGLFLSLLTVLVCAMTFLYGCTMGGDEFDSLFEKKWQNPSSLTDNISPDSQDATLPQTAMDNNGNIILVWTQSDGATIQIFKSEYRNGQWHHPANLSDHISFSGQNSRNPHVAMDNNGNTIVIWEQSEGAASHIFKSEYRNGVWHNPASPSDYIGGGCNSQLAMDDNGNAIIIWENFEIYKIEYRNGSWDSPSYLFVGMNDNPLGQIIDQMDYLIYGGNLWQPQVAMDNNGNAIIVWFEATGFGDNPLSPQRSGIFKSEYRNGVWTSPVSVNPEGQFPGYLPQVAMDNNGNAIIVWEQFDGDTNWKIFKSEYRNGVWTNPANLSDNISPDGQHAWNPQVAMDDNGNAIIAWSQSDGTNWQIFKSEYRSGAWTNPANLSDNISPDGQDVCPHQLAGMAMDNKGNALIVWQQFDGFNWQIFKSEYGNGAWTNPASLSDNISPYGQDASTIVQHHIAGETFWNPQVAMSNNGNAIIVWSQSDGTNYKIFKSEYR
jgi:hypothetical protein